MRTFPLFLYHVGPCAPPDSLLNKEDPNTKPTTPFLDVKVSSRNQIPYKSQEATFLSFFLFFWLAHT
jgi:hypothetical protein